MMRIWKCKMCNAEIYWILSRHGRWMPVNTSAVLFRMADSSEPGAMLLNKADGSTCWAVADKDGSEVGYISHFATCPKAARRRR